MSNLVTVESMVELRKKLGVLPTLMDVRISPNLVTVMCRDALGNLPEDLRDTVSQEFILSLSARGATPCGTLQTRLVVGNSIIF